MRTADYALVGYPLSDNFRRGFELTTQSQPQYLGIPALRRLPFVRLVNTLIRLKAHRLFIALEGESSRAFLPVFYCFAGLASAREIQIVYPDLRCERVSRIQTWKALASVIGASFSGARSLWRCHRELTALARQPRIRVKPSGVGPVLYLKTNLWAGLKAGGSIGHVAGVVNALTGQGYPVELAGLEFPLMADPEVRFIPVPGPRAYGIPAELNLYRFQLMIVDEARKFTTNRSFAFVYQRMSVSNYAGPVLSRQQGIPLVLEYNGSEVWASKNWGVAPRFHRTASLAEDMCLKHAHVIVTVSEVLREELLARGVEQERIVCYPNCIDPRVFAPDKVSSEQIVSLRRKWGIAPEATVCAFVGTFGQWHGVEILAEAVRCLVLKDPTWLRSRRIHFLMVGDGLKMGKVKTILADESCRPFFTLTGLVGQAEAPSYMAAADILLSPHVSNSDGTRFFGSPTKLFEYMAMGKPIIASRLEQIGTVLERSLDADHLPDHPPCTDDRCLAILSPPGKVESLIRGIRFLADNPDWSKVLGANARQEALSRYTWDRHTRAILEKLASL